MQVPWPELGELGASQKLPTLHPLLPGGARPSLPAPAVRSHLRGSATPLKAVFSGFTDLHNHHPCLILERHPPKATGAPHPPPTPHPSPREALAALLSPWICLLRTFHVNGIFCASLPSLSTLFSSPTHSLASVRDSSLVTVEYDSVEWTCHVLFIRSPGDGHLRDCRL